METLDAIMTRRSVAKVSAERPPRALIAKLLEAAVRAPTHHLTQPWRFVVLAGDARRGLGDAWAAADLREGKRDPDQARAKALRAPVIVTVIECLKPHLPKVVEIEEHYAVGAAVQNLLLAAHDLGLAAMIRTGPAAGHPEVRDFLELEDCELVAGFVYVGFPVPDAPERPLTRRTSAGDLTQWWGWTDQTAG
jgi:nitroreductase